MSAEEGELLKKKKKSVVEHWRSPTPIDGENDADRFSDHDAALPRLPYRY